MLNLNLKFCGIIQFKFELNLGGIMFLDKISNKVKGYVDISVCGFFVERFLNLALREDIKLWNLKRDVDLEVKASVNIFDYKKLVKIAKRAGCKISIVKKVGIPFIVLKYKKRKTFAIFSIMIAIFIYVYGLHIWNIEIVGDFSFSIEDIKSELIMENVRVGALKNALDIPKIKNNIYMRRHDIAWIGISFKGTKAVVEVVEANLKKIDELDKAPCNIICTKDGVIQKINALEGTATVKVRRHSKVW